MDGPPGEAREGGGRRRRAVRPGPDESASGPAASAPWVPPDDSDVGWGEPPPAADPDERFRSERPPHHDR